jgi:hypothetical protein
MIENIYYILGSISFCLVISSKIIYKCCKKNNQDNEDYSYIKLEEVDLNHN